MKTIALCMAFVGTLIPAETRVLNQHPLPPANVHVRFVNNNRHVIVQSVNAPGHTIEIDTQRKPATATKPIHGNPTADISGENEQGPAAPHAQSPSAPTASTINNNDMIIVQQTNIPQATPTAPTNPEPQLVQAKTTSISSPGSGLLSWIITKPIVLLCCGAALSYAGLIIKVMMLNHAIRRSQGWALWNQEIPVEQLRKKETATAKQLIADVQKKYAPTEEKNNLFTALVTFMHETRNELASLQNYIKLITWLKHNSMLGLIPDQQETWRIAVQKIERLEYLRHLATSHACERTGQ